MVAGKTYNGLMTDIWSAGVILYAMLCGYLPFEDSNTSELYKKIMNTDPVLPNFLSKNAKGMLMGILAKGNSLTCYFVIINFHLCGSKNRSK